MKYFIIAGEPSGDLHGSGLVRHLRRSDPGAEIVCWGGDLMQEAGARLLKHYRDTAFMGLWEVMVNIGKVMGNFRLCKRQITEMEPDVVILIDYPGFNLRMARFTAKRGIRVIYYIAPQLWAWREGRVKMVRRYVDRLYIIFPFETEFYQRHDYHAVFLGNPLIDHIDEWRLRSNSGRSIRSQLLPDKRPVIALLPGSRLQEVKRILPVMASLAASWPDYQFVVAGMDHLPSRLYEKITATYPVKVISGRTYDLLDVAEAALVTSGTATLETALLNVPQVVCYATSRLTYRMARLFIRVRFISLVNLIMDKEAVRELVQEDLTLEELHRELAMVLPTGFRHRIMKNDYLELRRQLGGSGASERVAEDMVAYLSGREE